MPGEPATVAEALRAATATLEAARSLSPRLDAELLLAEALGLRRQDLFAAPERPLERGEAARFDTLVRRRQKQEPVAYILGRRAFRTIELEVNDNTLIPRPETETLVEVCLEKLAGLRRNRALRPRHRHRHGRHRPRPRRRAPDRPGRRHRRASRAARRRPAQRAPARPR